MTLPPALPPAAARTLTTGQGSIGRHHARRLARRGMQVAAVRDWQPGHAMATAPTTDPAAGVAAQGAAMGGQPGLPGGAADGALMIPVTRAVRARRSGAQVADRVAMAKGAAAGRERGAA